MGTTSCHGGAKMKYIYINSKITPWVIVLVVVTVASSFADDLQTTLEAEHPDLTLAAQQLEDHVQNIEISTSDTIDVHERELIVDSIPEPGDLEHQLYPLTDESLAVDGDLVRTDYRPQLLDTPQIPASNVTINANSSLTEIPLNATSPWRCTCTTDKENGGQPVELVNSTRLVNILITDSNVTSRKTAGDCVAIMFYAQFCSFSAMAAPHFNALPRAFPDIKMAAVDAMKFHSFNTQYGIVGVPTVMLFHNGRPVSKFNESEYTLELFAKFITKSTGIEPDNKLLYVVSADFGGPVSSVPTKEIDYCLAMSWIFIIMCGVYFFSKSAYWKWIVETTQNTWREAEAQHEHAE